MEVLTDISIHALLAESDEYHDTLKRLRDDFYPRSPCGERPPPVLFVNNYFIFLSTLSLRRATIHHRKRTIVFTISIHALLAESDFLDLVFLLFGQRFLSTLSLRRATGCNIIGDGLFAISIHALLAESDLSGAQVLRHTAISIHALLAESDQIKEEK